MANDKTEKGQSVSILFMLLLLMVLGMSTLAAVLFGAEVYENIGERSENSFGETTALAYISNKVKQGDMTGAVYITETDGISVLNLEEYYNDRKYNTMIYCKDGFLKELFTSAGSGLGLEDGLEIMELKEMKLEKQECGSLLISTRDKNGDEQSLTLTLRTEQGEEI
ncbi:MAG: DUF4860 domain-containing protein [Anaerovoracaceae bacterium]